MDEEQRRVIADQEMRKVDFFQTLRKVINERNEGNRRKIRD